MNEELPKLADTDLEFPWKKILPIPPFNNVVENIWREESEMNPTLVGDMWLYLCLGLRPNELKKINLFTKNGKIAKFIRIKEGRSGVILTRYVP